MWFDVQMNNILWMYKFQRLSQLPRQIFRFVFGKGLSFAYAILENIATDSTENYFRMSDFFIWLYSVSTGTEIPELWRYDYSILSHWGAPLFKLNGIQLNDVGMKIKMCSFIKYFLKFSETRLFLYILGIYWDLFHFK